MRIINPNLVTTILKQQIDRDSKTGFTQGINRGIRLAISTLNNVRKVPSEDARLTIHAKWKFNKHCAPDEKLYYCSNCISGGSDTGVDSYCPNCGALMEVGGMSSEGKLVLSDEVIDKKHADNPAVIELVLCEGVKTIKSCAFNHCFNLSKVWLPSTLEEIESFAFRDCHSLKAIRLPPNLNAIGAGVFSGCPEDLTIIIAANSSLRLLIESDAESVKALNARKNQIFYV